MTTRKQRRWWSKTGALSERSEFAGRLRAESIVFLIGENRKKLPNFYPCSRKVVVSKRLGVVAIYKFFDYTGEMITLETQTRDKSENVVKLRKEGKMPAVFYGPGSTAKLTTGQSKKTKSTPITILRNDFIKVWGKVGESGVVTLQSKDGPVDTLIHAVDLDPVTDVPRHADFYVFEKGKKIEVSVPLDFVGVSPAVKDLGGSIVKSLHELKISADPQSIPHDIKVDISSLVDFNSQILASDIVLPAGVILVELPREVVVSAAPPKEEEVEEAPPVDLSSIEVEKKGKQEEEGESTPETAPKAEPTK